jgi:hypothetical protein
MKKQFMLALIAIFTISLTLEAQNQKSNNNNGTKRIQLTAGERADRLAKQLKLSDAEKMDVELYYINVDRRRQETIEKLKKVAKDSDERNQILETEQSRNDSDLRIIIGQEKMNKYIQIREDRQYRNRNK